MSASFVSQIGRPTNLLGHLEHEILSFKGILRIALKGGLMRFTFFTLVSILSLQVLATNTTTSYSVDENHLPGYRSPAVQKQAQEARPEAKEKDLHHRKGTKSRANPEAIDQPSTPRDLNPDA